MYLINGNFLCRNLTGIERFSFEICKCIDRITKQNFISIYIPKNAKYIPEFNNISLIYSDIALESFPKWDCIIFRKACKKLKSIGINFGNTAPLGKYAGLCFLHDIYPKLYPQDFSSLKDKLIRLYSCLHYKNIALNAKHIFTVSDYSKLQIAETYKVNKEKIDVISNGWDHFKNIIPDESIFNKYPALNNSNFYFTLGSLQKRKNLKWIAEYTSNHPEEVFAISGKAISGMVSDDIKVLQNLKNVILLGYVTDEQVKALMLKCKAFVFPSYYEGFGIPPLEALSTGAKIVISSSACLPEIFKNSAYYIDPNNPDCNLSDLLTQNVESAEKILNEYTYDKSAQKLYNYLLDNEEL